MSNQRADIAALEKASTDITTLTAAMVAAAPYGSTALYVAGLDVSVQALAVLIQTAIAQVVTMAKRRAGDPTV